MSLEIPDKREPADPSGETNISPGPSGVDGRTVSDKQDAFVRGLPADWKQNATKQFNFFIITLQICCSALVYYY